MVDLDALENVRGPAMKVHTGVSVRLKAAPRAAKKFFAAYARYPAFNRTQRRRGKWFHTMRQTVILMRKRIDNHEVDIKDCPFHRMLATVSECVVDEALDLRVEHDAPTTRFTTRSRC
jgi:hypothetical protein